MVTAQDGVCVLTKGGHTTIMLADEIADYKHFCGELDYVTEYANLTAFMLNEEDLTAGGGKE